MRTTRTFSRILRDLKKSDARTLIRQGGTSSGKTYSILQIIYIILRESKQRLLASVIAETLPALKRGAMKDFFDIIAPEYNGKYHNKTDNIYTVNSETGSQIEFFGADNEAKVRGARRDILFLNEANNIRQSVRDQLEVRTKQLEFIDFNPTYEFWAHSLKNNPGVYFDVSTYKDNQYVDKSIVASIESRRLIDPEWYKVFGLGEIGSIEGLVFPYFEQINAMPEIETTLGLDFGFTGSAMALIESGISGDSMYIRELIYDYGMLIPNLMCRMEQLGVRKNRRINGRVEAGESIIADCAQPQFIEEMARAGWNIKKCKKFDGSIMAGVDYVRRFKLKITKNSTNWIKEARNYRFQENKKSVGPDDKFLNKPIDAFNDAMDATRYSNDDRIKIPQIATSAKERF